jgi:signal transduction histidine kinase
MRPRRGRDVQNNSSAMDQFRCCRQGYCVNYNKLNNLLPNNGFRPVKNAFLRRNVLEFAFLALFILSDKFFLKISAASTIILVNIQYKIKNRSMHPENISKLEISNHAPGARERGDGKHANLLKIGALFSNPWVTTFVSVISSVAIYYLIHILYSKPILPFEMTLPVIIPLLVAYPISIMFRFFTRELEYSNHSLMQANNEIACQKKELEELNEIKLKLFSIVAHDLRSPVAMLYGFLDFMREEGTTLEDVIRLVPAMAEHVQTTLQLMDNLLKWSNTQMHGINPSLSAVDLTTLIAENTALFKGQLEKKNITLHIENNTSNAVLADLDMIRLVLRNLSANAIKFTSPNGDIHIKTKDVADQVYVTVQDTGVGISLSDQQKLFRPDVHYTTPGTNNEKGTGLGLMLCKQFIEKHNGKIWVESEVGKGSQFCFTLPKSQSSITDAAA